MVLIFAFWDLSFKVYNNTCIMPRFGKKNIFINSNSVFLKLMIMLILKITFMYIYSGYQTRIFYFIMSNFDKQFIFNNFTGWFKGKLFY